MPRGTGLFPRRGNHTTRATSFVSAIEDPDNFKKARYVAAWIGLTTRRYQSGDVDYDGHISRRGDRYLRGLLYKAAAVMLTRCSTEIACARGDSSSGKDRLQKSPPWPWRANWR